MGTTEIGGAGRAFPTTSWTLVRGAQAGPEAEACWNQLVSLYWKPVYWWVRTRWSKSNEDAKDLTQEFFADFLARDKLADLSQGHPRFRLFLRACLQNFLLTAHRDAHRQKRGGGVAHVPLDPAACDIDVADPSLGPEEAFDLAWTQTILSACVATLEQLYTSSNRRDYWEVFSRYHLSVEEPAYKDCAEALGLTTDAVQNRLRHARRTLRNLVRERVRDTLADPGDLEDELRALRQ